MIRFILFTSPKGLGWFSKLDTFGDSRVYRALSLLLLDVATITSATKPTNLLVDFVPFAICAVLVLCKSIPPQQLPRLTVWLPVTFDLALAKTEDDAIPITWSFCNETRRFALYQIPAPSRVSTLSIRRISGHTIHTIPLPSPDSSDTDPPPAPTRSAHSLRAALRSFATQERQNSRAVLDGHTKAKAESPTLQSPTTTQSPRSARSSVRRFLSTRSRHSETQSIRSSLRRGHRPHMTLVINPDEQVPDVPPLVESSVPPESGVYASELLRIPPPRKHSNRTRRSSTSSGLTYLTPTSQKNVLSRRPSYLLSPKSYQQSTASTPRTPVPTWEDMYRQQGLQSDSRPEVPPLPSRSGSINPQSTSPRTPPMPYIPFVARSLVSPPPGLTKFQPIVQSSLLANTPPVERTSGIKGPRPLVTTSRPRGSALRDSS